MAQLHAPLGSVSKDQTADRPVSLGDDKNVKLDSPLLTLTPNIEGNFIGIATSGDCVCALGYSKPYVWIYNLKTNSSKRHTLTTLEAVGMTTVGNTVVITDKNKKLHFIIIDQQNLNLTQQQMKNIPFEPRKVVYDHATERLIIANYSDKQIVLCNKTGDIEKRITVKTDLKFMMCALPTAGGAFTVLDYFPQSRVHWVNQSGDVMHTYGDAGAHELLYFPRHMLQDSQGGLLLVDTYNHCIRLMKNQQLSHELIPRDDGMEKLKPYYVHLDETAGTLFVGYKSDGQKLNMYRWPFTELKID